MKLKFIDKINEWIFDQVEGFGFGPKKLRKMGKISNGTRITTG